MIICILSTCDLLNAKVQRECTMFAFFFSGGVGRRAGESMIRTICQIDKSQTEND